MSDSSQKPWSNNPNTPQIPYDLYLWEKAAFAGGFIGAILYGLPTYISICSVFTYLLRSINCSRNRHRDVLPMYYRPVQSRQSQKGEYKVGTRDLHRPHVLVCHHTLRHGSQSRINFLHRQP